MCTATLSLFCWQKILRCGLKFVSFHIKTDTEEAVESSKTSFIEQVNVYLVCPDNLSFICDRKSYKMLLIISPRNCFWSSEEEEEAIRETLESIKSYFNVDWSILYIRCKSSYSKILDQTAILKTLLQNSHETSCNRYFK